MESGLVFGIVVGVVLAFLAYKGYQMNRKGNTVPPTDPKKSGGGYSGGTDLGELPKDVIK